MIRLAEQKDMDDILRVYDTARAFMQASGNTKQWVNGYPQRELLESDIARDNLFLIEENGAIHAVFAFILGNDPAYNYIEDGHWLNDKPYGTIHRIASDGQIKGMFTRAFDFCRSKMDEIRIDTHHDNKTMQHVVAKHGFKRCGIIYLENGAPRIAYQYSKEA